MRTTRPGKCNRVIKRWTGVAAVLAVTLIVPCGPPAFAASPDAQVQAIMGSRAMTLENQLRAQWLEHIFWSREMARHASEGEEKGRELAESRAREAATSLCAALRPFFGADRTDELRRFFDGYMDALEAYLSAAVEARGVPRGSPPLLEARDTLLSRAEGIARFVAAMSPNIWPSTAGGTLGAQAGYQMTDIKLLLTGHHAEESATWDLLRKNSYALAGAMALATIRQFPDEFVPELKGAGRALNQ